MAAAFAREPGIHVVNEGGIREAWTLAPGTQLAVPAYPPELSAAPAETCLAIGYLIHPDGSTSDFALVKSWTAAEVPKADQQAYWAAFAQSAAAALQQWRFRPRPEVAGPRPVYTVATFVFGSTQPQELRKRCAIADLVEHLRILRQDPGSRRLMNPLVWDRLELNRGLRPRDPGSMHY